MALLPRYRLDFPDREVKQTFMGRLLEFYGGLRKGLSGSVIEDFYETIGKDDLEGFMNVFQSFLARIIYDLHIPNEKYYQRMKPRMMEKPTDMKTVLRMPSLVRFTSPAPMFWPT